MQKGNGNRGGLGCGIEDHTTAAASVVNTNRRQKMMKTCTRYRMCSDIGYCNMCFCVYMFVSSVLRTSMQVCECSVNPQSFTNAK